VTVRAAAAVLTAAVVVLSGCAPSGAGGAAGPGGGSGGVDLLALASDGRAVDGVLVPGTVDDVAATVARNVADGRPTVVNLFASWCAPCEREMPLLLDAATARPDVAWLGVAHADVRLPAEQWVERLGVDIPSVFDPDGTVAEAVGLRGMPTTLFVAADGTVVAQHTGELTEALLEGYLADIAP
jgi:cytochrome c biogenesis protein CcmG, thiol:disulfide interchange protein DsbE